MSGSSGADQESSGWAPSGRLLHRVGRIAGMRAVGRKMQAAPGVLTTVRTGGWRFLGEMMWRHWQAFGVLAHACEIMRRTGL